MNINLRKANAIQKQILESIAEIEITADVSINEFQDPELEITKYDRKRSEEAHPVKKPLAIFSSRKDPSFRPVSHPDR